MTQTVWPQQLAAVVKADLNRWAEKAKGDASEALYRAGLSLEKHAKRLCPVDTGTLRASLHTVRIDAETVEVRDGVKYGKFLEFGTVNMNAQPYMRPAIYASENERLRIMAEAFDGP